jgi:RES domain-containing protein
LGAQVFIDVRKFRLNALGVPAIYSYREISILLKQLDQGLAGAEGDLVAFRFERGGCVFPDVFAGTHDESLRSVALSAAFESTARHCLTTADQG